MWKKGWPALPIPIKMLKIHLFTDYSLQSSVQLNIITLLFIRRYFVFLSFFLFRIFCVFFLRNFFITFLVMIFSWIRRFHSDFPNKLEGKAIYLLCCLILPHLAHFHGNCLLAFLPLCSVQTIGFGCPVSTLFHSNEAKWLSPPLQWRLPSLRPFSAFKSSWSGFPPHGRPTLMACPRWTSILASSSSSSKVFPHPNPFGWALAASFSSGPRPMTGIAWEDGWNCVAEEKMTKQRHPNGQVDWNFNLWKKRWEK
jgi:hypothetical protein